MGKIFLQINSAAVAFIDILIAAWEGLTVDHEVFIENDGIISFHSQCSFVGFADSSGFNHGEQAV